jgi:hypothetical protein
MRIYIAVTFVAAWLVLACGTYADQTPPAKPAADAAPAARAQQLPKHSNVNPDAGVIADFKAKVEKYVDLRKDLEKKAPPLKKTEDPGEIQRSEKMVQEQVRAARAHAKPGDIFTPATAAMFRRLLHPTVKGEDGAENKKAIKDDAPAPKEVPFKLNAEYPQDAPLSTVPPDILESLPQLPESMQYRFVGKHLILYDVRGNLIVDYMLNAIP